MGLPGISIKYISSGTRVPDRLSDRVPIRYLGNKLPGYGSPTHQGNWQTQIHWECGHQNGVYVNALI